MASKTSKTSTALKTRTASKPAARKPAGRSFDVLLPRLGREREGVTFAAGNYVRKTGTVPALLVAVKLNGSPLGVHAAAKGGDVSLCGCSLVPTGGSERQTSASGQAAKVATSVTCRFCQARLVGAGVLDPQAEGVSAYAADYGST